MFWYSQVKYMHLFKRMEKYARVNGIWLGHLQVFLGFTHDKINHKVMFHLLHNTVFKNTPLSEMLKK